MTTTPTLREAAERLMHRSIADRKELARNGGGCYDEDEDPLIVSLRTALAEQVDHGDSHTCAVCGWTEVFLPPVAPATAEQTEPSGDTYEDLYNALQRIDTVACMHPLFKVEVDGGLDACVENIVRLIQRTATPAAEQAESVTVPAGYALVPVDSLKGAAAQAKVAADCIVGFAKDNPGKMRGWLDDACTAADTAAEMFSSILATPPAPAAEQPEPVVWECKAGGLKKLTQSQYDKQRDVVKQYYSRIETPAVSATTDEDRNRFEAAWNQHRCYLGSDVGVSAKDIAWAVWQAGVATSPTPGCEQASPAYLAEPGAAQATRADLVANWPQHNRVNMTVKLYCTPPTTKDKHDT